MTRPAIELIQRRREHDEATPGSSDLIPLQR